MFSINTGEPPTPPNQRVTGDTSRTVRSSGGSETDVRSQSLTAQEQDSGYEASPCSIADNTSGDLHFFGDHQEPTTTDDVFDDCSSSFLLLECGEDNTDCRNCCDCGSTSPCSCLSSATIELGSSRAESSATMRLTPDSNCENSSSSDHSGRPSSLPILIPVIEQHYVPPRPSDNDPREHAREAPSSSSLLQFYTRSCPSTMTAWMSAVNPFSRMRAELERRNRRASADIDRSRRRQIDSDLSSSVEDLSDDDYLSEDELESSYPEVFPMSEEDCPTPFSPLSPVQLPDIILHSSPSTVRRNRSSSINLPPEQESSRDTLLRDIGRRLRRLSNEFETTRELNRTRRRQTISSFDWNNRSS